MKKKSRQKPSGFLPVLPKLTPIATAVTAALSCAPGAVAAQTIDESEIEEIVVRGVRAAQISAINTKRSAANIVEAISTEDIGKLPDVTITDSLQRITGVQINRSAAEGSGISIRGLPQILTTLNGESFLGAGSITTVQPDLNDIPSQLFAGAEVIKSATANTNAGGITGVVNLRTYRPFRFNEGLTLSGAAELQTGVESSESDPSVNGLINWRNDRLGLMASFSYQEKNLANYYSGMAGGGSNAGWSQIAGEDWAWGADVNGDGDQNDAFVAYQGHQASNQFTERERLGFSGALQFDIGEGFEVVAEVFYTEMEDYARAAGLVHSDKWNRWGWFEPGFDGGSASFTDTGAVIDGRNLFTVEGFTGNGRRLKSFTTNTFEDSSSTNANLELNYDNGGSFTASARASFGRADKDHIFGSADIDLAAGNQWGVQFQNYPAGLAQATNPNGYEGFPPLTIDYRGDGSVWSGFQNDANLGIDGSPGAGTTTIADLLADVNSYGVGAITSENNYQREAEMDIVRLDGSYDFADDGFFRSVEAGVRYSAREAQNNQFDIAAPFGPNDCLVKWKATDVTLNQDSCNWGENLDDGDPDNDIFFTSGVPMNVQALGNVIQVTDLGPVSGIPAFFAIDPRVMDDMLAFHNSIYPDNVVVPVPGSSYSVDLDELSYYLQANFEVGAWSGNFGIRQVDTTLTVVQNIVGDSQPYGVAPIDAGDRVTRRDYSDTLPSINVNYDITDNLRLRVAYAKTMTPLDLEQWGGAFDPDFTFDGDPDSPTFQQFIAVGATENGNPLLDPWRADNFDVSLEYYVGQASLFSAGLFRVEVDSFTERGEEQRELPDADGVIRRSVPVSTITQGDGGTLEGVELAAKFAFSDFTSNPVLGYFGADVNYTYSPSDSGTQDLQGNDLGFPENSEDVFNLVAWFESNRWQARVGYNYRSERVVLLNQAGALTLMQEATGYLDASIRYFINDQVSIYVNGANLTDESERFYLQFEQQEAWQNTFEPRYTFGVRATF